MKGVIILAILFLVSLQVVHAGQYPYLIVNGIHHNQVGTPKEYSVMHSYKVSIAKDDSTTSNRTDGGALLFTKVTVVIDADQYLPSYIYYLANGTKLLGVSANWIEGPAMGSSQKFLRMSLNEPILTNVNTFLSDGGRPMAELTFKYQNIEWLYEDATTNPHLVTYAGLVALNVR